MNELTHNLSNTRTYVVPYKSDAQRKYFNANRKELESQGVDVDEWNDSSRGKKLPEKVKEKEASDALNMLHRQASQLLTKFAADADVALLARATTKSACINKRAYGFYDDDSMYERYMAGGHAFGLSPEELVKDILETKREAELNKVRLAFSPYRYHLNPETSETDEYDADEAIRRVKQHYAKPLPAKKSSLMKRLLGLRQPTPGQINATGETLPNFFSFTAAPGGKIDWDNWKEEQEAKEKTASDVELLARATVKQARTKQAFVAWGGGSLGLHPKGRGIGGELGYTNLLGLVPIPLGGIDIGGSRKGFQMGVTPDPGSDIGVSPYFGLRWNHPRKSGITRNFPRGLPEVLYDQLRGRTKLDAMRASYPELFENDESEATNEAKPEAEKKEKFERKPKEEKKANAIAQLAMNAVPSLVLGSAFGGLKGLAENPGVNPETGKDKSRLMNILTGMLSGAASGGLGSLKAGAERPGLWANIHAKRKRGEKPAKPGEKDYPDSKSWNATVKAGAVDRLISLIASGRYDDSSPIQKDVALLARASARQASMEEKESFDYNL